MGIAYLQSGQKIILDGSEYVMSRLISNNEWQLECQNSGLYITYKTSDLEDLYIKQRLIFSRKRNNFGYSEIQSDKNQIIYLDTLSEELRDSAKTKLAYVKAYIKSGEVYKTKKTLSPIIADTWGKIKSPENAPDWSTVCRWIKRYVEGGNDIRALVSKTNLKGNRTK